jgi:hypothetical protein
MRVAVWHEDSTMGRVDRRRRRERRDWVVGQLDIGPDTSYRDACHRVGQVLAEVLGAEVELRFVNVQNERFSGITAQRANGTFIVFCARSRSWYHRLGILLHELAHPLLGHKPVTLASDEGIHQWLPNLPDRMIELIAGRTGHTEREEREAEALADDILAHIEDVMRTEQQAAAVPSEALQRIAEALGHNPPWERR